MFYYPSACMVELGCEAYIWLFTQLPLLPGFPHTLVLFADKTFSPSVSNHSIFALSTVYTLPPSLIVYSFLRPLSVHLVSSWIQFKYTCETIYLKLGSSYERQPKAFVFQAPSYVIQQFFS